MVTKLKVFADAHTPVVDEVCHVLALHGISSFSIRARTCAGVAALEVDHEGQDAARAEAITSQLRAVRDIRYAEYDIPVRQPA